MRRVGLQTICEKSPVVIDAAPTGSSANNAMIVATEFVPSSKWRLQRILFDRIGRRAQRVLGFGQTEHPEIAVTPLGHMGEIQ